MPYAWLRGDSQPTFPTQLVAQYVTDDIDIFVDVNDLSLGPAVGANFTILPAGLEGVVPDPMARCLCIAHVVVGGAARGVTIRLRGMNQFGVNVEESVVIGAHAAGTTSIAFSRNAYRILGVATLTAVTSAALAGDRLDIGLATLAATAAGTHDATNGAGATDYKAFGLPAAITATDGVGTAVAADFPAQIHGVVFAISDTLGPPAALDSFTTAPISRAGDFKVDPTFATMTPDEDFVTDKVTGAGVAQNIMALITVTPNNRISEVLGAGGSPPAVPI